MGNQQTNVLKEKYLKGDLKIRDSYRDSQLGLVSVFELFTNQHEGQVMQKIINPQASLGQFDFQKIVEKMTQNHPFLSSFYFFNKNQLNEQLYDLIFENGDPIQIPIKIEENFWKITRHILEALKYLEY